MSHLFLIAFRNLVQHRKRTALLGGAIAGVTALLVFLICLSSGVHATMFESATTLMSGHINVAGFYKVTAGQAAPLVTNYEHVAQIVQKTLPDLDYIAPRGRGWARLVSDAASVQAGIGGITIANEPGLKRVLHIVEGKLEDLGQPDTILIFEEQAKKLDVHVGDAVIISTQTARGTNNTTDVRVAAIAQDIGILSSFNVFIPEISLRKLYQLKDDSAGALLIYIKDVKRIPQDMDQLQKAFEAEKFAVMDREAKPFWEKIQSVNREDWTGQKLDLTSWEEETSFLQWSMRAIDGLTFILTVVLLSIIGVGVMNSMWIAIRERTREIGTLRAIGMHRTRVLSMFVIEAFTLGALATALGAATGCLLALVVDVSHLQVPRGARLFLMSNTIHFAFDAGHIVGGMFVITGCMTLVSLIPSTQAARLKPITAMQHIG